MPFYKGGGGGSASSSDSPRVTRIQEAMPGCPLRPPGCRAPGSHRSCLVPSPKTRVQVQPAGTLGEWPDVTSHTHPSSTWALTRGLLPAPAQWPSAEPALHAGPLVASLAAAGLRRPSRVLPLHAATSEERTVIGVGGGVGPLNSRAKDRAKQQNPLT